MIILSGGLAMLSFCHVTDWSPRKREVYPSHEVNSLADNILWASPPLIMTKFIVCKIVYTCLVTHTRHKISTCCICNTINNKTLYAKKCRKWLFKNTCFLTTVLLNMSNTEHQILYVWLFCRNKKCMVAHYNFK